MDELGHQRAGDREHRDPDQARAAADREARADEAAPGSGLGLAIVADLVELYGGSIALDASPLGGLRATLHLPAA